MNWKRTVWIIFVVFTCLRLQSAEVKVLFSPKDQVAKHLIARIDQEGKQVLVAVYCLSHRGIADALVRAKRRGVDVNVLVDPFSLRCKAALGKLTHAEVPLAVWDDTMFLPMRGAKAMRSQGRRPLMHNKFCVFGGSVVWTGSFNFTYDASVAHCENVVIIEDREIARKYTCEFYAIKTQAGKAHTAYQKEHPPKQKTVLDLVLRK